MRGIARRVVPNPVCKAQRHRRFVILRQLPPGRFQCLHWSRNTFPSPDSCRTDPRLPCAGCRGSGDPRISVASFRESQARPRHSGFLIMEFYLCVFAKSCGHNHYTPRTQQSKFSCGHELILSSVQDRAGINPGITPAPATSPRGSSVDTVLNATPYYLKKSREHPTDSGSSIPEKPNPFQR